MITQTLIQHQTRSIFLHSSWSSIDIPMGNIKSIKIQRIKKYFKSRFHIFIVFTEKVRYKSIPIYDQLYRSVLCLAEF